MQLYLQFSLFRDFTLFWVLWGFFSIFFNKQKRQRLDLTLSLTREPRKIRARSPMASYSTGVHIFPHPFSCNTRKGKFCSNS